MLPAAAAASPARTTAVDFRDGLGDRFVAADNASGAPVQVLRLREDMTEVPAFEFALRERTARLANFRHDAYARPHRVHRMPGAGRELVLISEHVEGIRLSALLSVAEQQHVHVDLGTALSVVRQLLQAITLLHDHAPDIANGLIAPERLIVTPTARVRIAEQVLCVAVEQLRYSRDRLWRELRIASRPDIGPVRFSHRTDVMSIGLVALALVLGRPLRDAEFPDGLPALLDAAREHSALGYTRPLSPPLRDWMDRALQLDPHRSFASAPDAWRAFEAVVDGDPLYLSSPMALERFLFSCTSALIQPPPLGRPAPAPLAAPQDPGPVPHPDRAPRSPYACEPATMRSEPEIHVEMLPPPDVPGGQATWTAPPDAIDWAGLANEPGAVVTDSDLKQLFADVDVTSPVEEAEPSHRAAAPPRPQEPVESARPLAEGRTEPVGVVPSEPLSEAGPDQRRGAVFERPRSEQPAPPDRRPTWNRFALAAALTGILAGGAALHRSLRPAVVTASEMGTLLIDSSPQGLPVLIDGTELGRTPARVPVSAGAHVLEVRGEGTPRVLPITVAGRGEVSYYIEFGTEPPPGPPVVEPAPAEATASATSPATPPPAAVPTWGWLDVKSALPLEIRAGGRTVGRSGGERLRLGEGRHEVELLNPEAGLREVRVVHVVAGKVTNLAVAAPASGVVHVNAAPWAEVWIDGRRVGDTPLANVTVPVGRHEVVFRHPTLGERRETITVTAGAPLRLSVDMR